jgi:hypothetical protein
MISLRFVGLAVGVAVLMGAGIGRGDPLDLGQDESSALNLSPKSSSMVLQFSSLSYIPIDGSGHERTDVGTFVSPNGSVHDLTAEDDPRNILGSRLWLKGSATEVSGPGHEAVSDHPQDFRPNYWVEQAQYGPQPVTSVQLETADQASPRAGGEVDPMGVVVPAVMVAVTVSQAASHGKHRDHGSRPESHHSSRHVSSDEDDDSWLGVLISIIFDAITNGDGGGGWDSGHHDSLHERREAGHEERNSAPQETGTEGKREALESGV